jgi:PAS domain S-box-containing protein
MLDLAKNLNNENDLMDDQAFLNDLADFFYHTPDLLCIADFNAQFKRVNPAVTKLLGYSEAELFSHSINYFVHPDDQNETSRTRTEMFQGKPLLDYENRYITKSGETVWLSWTSVPFVNRQLVFAVAKDITLRKKFEEEKNQLFNQLEAINKELEYFARIASHDLRAPVSNILALFDLFDESKINDEDSLNIINLIKQSTQKVYSTLEKYINDLKNKEKKKRLKTKESLSETTKTVINSIESILNKNKVKIDLDFSSFGYLNSIILNLITNAVKYADPNKLPYIKISSRLFEDKKQLLVTDNGIGMDLDAIRYKIFGLNQTFHHNKDGKGLGLYLVKTQLEEMGGSIEVKSEIDKGSTFIITFKS